MRPGTFQVFNNPDYKWANELTLKTAFLTLLYNDILYIMDSEHEAGRGYADLTTIIRPDMRKYQILDILIEFKYVKLSEANVTGKQACKDQARQYGKSLEVKYGNLRLKKFAVVSLGFERIWWEEVSKYLIFLKWQCNC